MDQRSEPSRRQRAYRSQRLRARGLTWEQIAVVWEIDHPEISPRIALRWAHNLSHQEVADRWNALDVGESTMVKARIYQFEHWPAKGRRPSVAALHALARIYQVTARRLLTDAEYALYNVSDQHEISQIDYTRADPNSSAHVVPGGSPTFPGTSEVGSPTLSRVRDRRPLDGNEQLGLYARESDLILSEAEMSNVGATTIERLNADLQRAADSYLKVPTGPLLADVRRIRDEALRLLEGHQPLRRRWDLYVIVGWAMTFLGWVSTDLGRPDAAEQHARAAWHFAKECRHDGLLAWVCKTRQVAAYWDDRKLEALTWAERGLSYGARVGGETEAMLTSTLALDYARLGRTEDARDMLHRAQEVRPGPADYPGGPLSCTPERALSYWADAYLMLNDPGQALEVATRSVDISQGRPAHIRNLGTERMTVLHIARAHIDTGALDGAAEVLVPILETPMEVRAAPLLLQLGEVAKRIPIGSRGGGQGRVIREAIGAFRAESRPYIEG
ncbi:tetratricopeptide repeat protein [Streptosporangium sp. NPDC051023]|uniref:tetratricopeptide repeat protein n=1 Tax=Streptosporangium sp. NPDC051023 TaxID=3155410 RepID=UPI00344F30E1